MLVIWRKVRFSQIYSLHVCIDIKTWMNFWWKMNKINFPFSFERCASSENLLSHACLDCFKLYIYFEYKISDLVKICCNLILIVNRLMFSKFKGYPIIFSMGFNFLHSFHLNELMEKFTSHQKIPIVFWYINFWRLKVDNIHSKGNDFLQIISQSERIWINQFPKE